MAVLFIILEQPVQQKFRGGHAEQADTLEFSLCASIAPDRRALSERAKHASFARRSGNRRRSARGTKFHLVPRFLYGVPGTSDFTDDDLICNMPISLCDTFHRFYPDHSSVTSEVQSDRFLLRNLDPIPEYPRFVLVYIFFAFLQESIE